MSNSSAFFSYTLPPERIAQYHAGTQGQRSSSKLLHARRSGDGSLQIADLQFSQILELLRPDDLLVLNNTKVLPLRFFGHNSRNGVALEMLLLRQLDANEQIWSAVGKPLKKVQSGDLLELSPGLQAIAGERLDEGRTISLRIIAKDPAIDIAELLVAQGSMPIPPYIRQGRAEEIDKSLYQTVYADLPGSIAAPTAGLHFTEALLAEIRRAGVGVVFVTLHVGLASFTRVESSSLDSMVVPTEYFSIEPNVAERILQQKSIGKRVIAVGTTTTRALESWMRFRKEGKDCSELTPTNLFLTPGAKFHAVDVLVTNFHQPETTHLLMVSAFIGGNQTEQIYHHALAGEYRFLSYGDAMLLECAE